MVEFCCGYGGATQGMLAAGLEMEACYDIWPVAVEQHLAWHPGVPCSVRDVATITPDELAGRLVWASLPCQPYSTANRYAEKRGKKHPHYYSLAHFARQVQHARLALIENVPGLVWSKEGRAELAELERECVKLGLSMSIHLVYSHWFGVQQWRRRVFVLIARNLPLVLIQAGNTSTPDAMDAAVQATHGGVNGSLGRKVMLPTEWAITATEGKGGPGRIRPALETAVTAHRREGVGGSWPLTVTAAEKRHERFQASVTCNPAGENVNTRSRVKRPRSVTATESDTMSMTDPRTGEQNFQGRTIERCAELQGLPVPQGVTKSAAYTLIGNAVPPLLAESIARQVFVPLLAEAALPLAAD